MNRLLMQCVFIQRKVRVINIPGDIWSTLFLGAIIGLGWWLADKTIKWEDEDNENNQD